MKKETARALEFLNGIGLSAEVRPGAAGFIKGVRIENGRLFVDPKADASNVLHEAGHLAVLPSSFRHLAQANIGGVQRLMMDRIDFTDPDSGDARAALQSGDCEATAWAWSAGLHLGLRPTRIIQNHEYSGAGSEIRLALSHKAYMGINGLAAANFCAVKGGVFAKARGLPAYPTLARWLQP